jgi:hypothetical protein
MTYWNIITLQYVSFYHFFTGDYNEAFHYEARSRLILEPSGVTNWRNSIEEFVEGYRNNWQFQKLAATVSSTSCREG